LVLILILRKSGGIGNHRCQKKGAPSGRVGPTLGLLALNKKLRFLYNVFTRFLTVARESRKKVKKNSALAGPPLRGKDQARSSKVKVGQAT